MKFRVLLLAITVLASACSSSQVEDTSKSVQKSAPIVLNDAAVVTQVTARLIGIDADSALHVAVSSHEGNVALSGKAKSASVAERFVAAAKDVSGVKSVASTIAVDSKLPPATQQAKDAAIVTGVTGALIGQAGVNALSVKVHVHDGAVTLEGDVKTEALKSTIVEAARHAPGVKSVADNLKVKP
jgi:osmotically-inducible protein OsmY